MKIFISIEGAETEKEIIVQVKCIFNQEENLLLVISASSYFAIDPMDCEKMYDKEKRMVTLPLSPALNLTSLEVSTLRGILHAKTKVFR